MNGVAHAPSGVLVVDKPEGITSHDVVNVIRRLTGTRRVGHTGTLDPMATGVLVLLIGVATRLSRFVMHGDKHYRGVVRLGTTTTTYDATGETVQQRPVNVDRADINRALSHYTGEIQQVPPMYAAIKVQGRKLYDIAREGKEVERKPRRVTIHQLDIIDWEPPDLRLDVVCSEGTYIRSLAYDLGEALGCGGHLRALRRLRNGPFTIAEAHTLETLEHLQAAGQIDHAILPPRSALAAMPQVSLTPEQEQAVRYGQTIPLTLVGNPDPVQAHDANGRLIAVLIPVDENNYRPTLVLPAPTGV
jgi:tRNA pseudouridine55 synthase